MRFLIQSRYSVTLVYTPGNPGVAHRRPKDTIPIKYHFLVWLSNITSGPPESPLVILCNLCEYDCKTNLQFDCTYLTWIFGWSCVTSAKIVFVYINPLFKCLFTLFLRYYHESGLPKYLTRWSIERCPTPACDCSASVFNVSITK